MIISNFDIKLNNPKYGWLYFSILKNNKPLINISASGVYNPFYEYVDILYDLKYNRKKYIEFYIDQEGFDAKIVFENKGIYLKITTETLSNKKHLPKSSGIFIKKKVINNMKNSLLRCYNSNKKEFNGYVYNFMFDRKKLLNI